jgi:hypothetical protein
LGERTRPRVQFPASRRKTLFGETPNTTRGTRMLPGLAKTVISRGAPLLAGATSDTNSFAGDPRGRVGREKDGHGGNILRFAYSAERSFRAIVLDVFLAKKPLRRCAFAPRIGWRNGIDSDPTRGKFGRQTLGKILDGGLGCGIEDSVRQGMAAGEGADIDDSALLEAELLDRLLNGQNGPKHVRREFAIEFRNGDTLKRFEFEDSGVVYQDVKPSKCSLGLREKAFDVFWIGNACLDGNSVAASVRDFGKHAVGPFLA